MILILLFDEHQIGRDITSLEPFPDQHKSEFMQAANSRFDAYPSNIKRPEIMKTSHLEWTSINAKHETMVSKIS